MRYVKNQWLGFQKNHCLVLRLLTIVLYCLCIFVVVSFCVFFSKKITGNLPVRFWGWPGLTLLIWITSFFVLHLLYKHQFLIIQHGTQLPSTKIFWILEIGTQEMCIYIYIMYIYIIQMYILYVYIYIYIIYDIYIITLVWKCFFTTSKFTWTIPTQFFWGEAQGHTFQGGEWWGWAKKYCSMDPCFNLFIFWNSRFIWNVWRFRSLTDSYEKLICIFIFLYFVDDLCITFSKKKQYNSTWTVRFQSFSTTPVVCSSWIPEHVILKQLFLDITLREIFGFTTMVVGPVIGCHQTAKPLECRRPTLKHAHAFVVTT